MRRGIKSFEKMNYCVICYYVQGFDYAVRVRAADLAQWCADKGARSSWTPSNKISFRLRVGHLIGIHWWLSIQICWYSASFFLLRQRKHLSVYVCACARFGKWRRLNQNGNCAVRSCNDRSTPLTTSTHLLWFYFFSWLGFLVRIREKSSKE